MRTSCNGPTPARDETQPTVAGSSIGSLTPVHFTGGSTSVGDRPTAFFPRAESVQLQARPTDEPQFLGDALADDSPDLVELAIATAMADGAEVFGE